MGRKYELRILHDPQSGQTSVTGPIDNPPLSFMMLEMAREIISDRRRARAEAQQSQIVIPQVRVGGNGG